MKYIIKKIITLIITLFVVSLLAFLAFQIIPADPAVRMLGTSATPEAIEQLRHQLGLDLPVMTRYLHWLAGVFRGDFGTSYSYKMPVSEMIMDKLPITIWLTIISFVITIIVAIPLGVWMGSVKNKVVDTIMTMFNQLCMSVPPFFIGIIMCFVCGITLKWFKPGEFVSYTVSWGKFINYLIFPAVAIAIPRIAMTVKMLRSSILSELDRDYVRTAQSRGNSRWSILLNHVFKNSIMPIITFMAISMAEIMTGTIIIEQVFTIPGIGRLLIASINTRDFPVVQAIVIILAAWIVIVNFAADIINQLVDPRVHLE